MAPCILLYISVHTNLSVCTLCVPVCEYWDKFKVACGVCTVLIFFCGSSLRWKAL